MIVAIRSFLIAVAALALQACLFETKPGGDPGETGLNPDGTRKHKAPVVAYAAADSLLEIRIQGSRAGEAANFWIYRNDTLLSPPDYLGAGDGGFHAYLLIDSVNAPGDYRYHVRYGSTVDSLGEKSKPYMFAYAGHSRSGRISISLVETESLFPTITLRTPADEIPLAARFQRKLGSEGRTFGLGTLESPAFEGEYSLLDTNFVAEDTVIYYRASILDGVKEIWLDPSPWDSIRVKNKLWAYAPQAEITNLGAEMRANITHFPSGPASPVFYLCRNTSASKSGRKRVDSTFAHDPRELTDVPATSGTYFYWIEAEDRWSRPSVRSIPKEFKFTGRPIGPAIISIQASGEGIQIQFPSDSTFGPYYVQRARDTAKDIRTVDTVYAFFNVGSSFDFPAASGYWWYRILKGTDAALASDPGPWARSPYFTYTPVYYFLDASILNQGNRVDAMVESEPNSYAILYRSRFATGNDSVAVDTLDFNSSSFRLFDIPPLGTWYYRVYRYRKNPEEANIIYRSDLVQVEFSGLVPGPEIASVFVYATYIAVSVQATADAVAYVLERSKDGEKKWAIVDTVSASPYGEVLIHDRPPEDGFWNYRVRGVMPSSNVSEPGGVVRSPRAWSSTIVYKNILNTEAVNMGASVQVALIPSKEAGTAYLMRSATSDFQNGLQVDSSFSSDALLTLRDSPPKGIWYYWVEIYLHFPTQYSAYRSVAPSKIDFSGTPSITSLAVVGSGIRITYARTALEDTLEIWRSAAPSGDTSVYALVLSLPAGDFAEYTVDTTVPKIAAIYSYRLRIRRQSFVSAMSEVRSIYYAP